MKIDKYAFALTVCGLLLSMSAARAATINLFTDQSAWKSVVSDFSTENFDDSLLNDGLTATTDNGTSLNGQWRDRLTPNTAGNPTNPTSTQFDFSSEILAFGGLWDTRPESHGTGIRVTLLNNGVEVLSQDIQDFDGGFWGFVSDTAFTSVLLTPGVQLAREETYDLNDMVYGKQIAASGMTAVPLPAAVWLFGSGLLGLLSISRRKSTLIV